jgi:hypothetical protein
MSWTVTEVTHLSWQKCLVYIRCLFRKSDARHTPCLHMQA